MEHLGHFQNLLQLLKLEREEDRRQYQEKIKNRAIDARIKEGVCWYPVTLSKSFLGSGEHWVIQVDRRSQQQQKHLFQAGGSVSVFLSAEKEEAATGIISRIFENQMTIVLNREDPPDWLEDGKLGIDMLFDESTYDEMERALQRLIKAKDKRILELMDIMLGQRIPEFFTRAKKSHYAYLNQSQMDALELIATARDLALVHGPPGTGKTTTLVEAIIETVAKEQQVLVCAPSNAAVDLLVEKLHQRGTNVVRLGHPARVNEEVVVHTLDVQIAQHDDARLLKNLRKKSEELKRLALQYKRNYGRSEAAQRSALLTESRQLRDEALALEGHIMFDILNKAEVIACTLVGANHSLMHNRTFKTVFIDECSQALEPACWIPIMKCHRVIMAGDHLQLPPTIKSIEAAKKGLGFTLFERSIPKIGAAHMLTVQYRMHHDIMAFSNQQFYQNALKCAEMIVLRKPYFSQSMWFVDTAGCGYQEALNEETLSTYNTEEAAFALKLLGRFIPESEGENTPSIGIIAPYKAQVDTLNKLIKDAGWPSEWLQETTINTVDAFQGLERDIILISLTRSNDRGEIGFLADERRLNVAMTRAKHLMLMVGDSATLSANPFFDHMIAFFQEKNAYRSAFEFNWNE